MALVPGRGITTADGNLSLLFSPMDKEQKGGIGMITYAELFAFCALIVAIIRLVHDFENRGK